MRSAWISHRSIDFVHTGSDSGEGRLGRETPTQSGTATWGMQTWPLELDVTPGGRIVQLGAGGWCVVLPNYYTELT